MYCYPSHKCDRSCSMSMRRNHTNTTHNRLHKESGDRHDLWNSYPHSISHQSSVTLIDVVVVTSQHNYINLSPDSCIQARTPKVQRRRCIWNVVLVNTALNCNKLIKDQTARSHLKCFLLRLRAHLIVRICQLLLGSFVHYSRVGITTKPYEARWHEHRSRKTEILSWNRPSTL